MNYRECAALLSEKDKILLVSHKNPDGDTVGSAAALCSALRRLGKTAYLYPNGQIIKKLRPTRRNSLLRRISRRRIMWP